MPHRLKGGRQALPEPVARLLRPKGRLTTSRNDRGDVLRRGRRESRYVRRRIMKGQVRPNSTGRPARDPTPIVSISPPTRASLVTQRERLSHSESFHLQRAKDPCWKSHSDLPCRMSLPSSDATQRTRDGSHLQIRKNTWPSCFIWFSGITAADADGLNL